MVSSSIATTTGIPVSMSSDSSHSFRYQRQIHVVLGPWSYRLAWCGILVGCLFVASYLGIQALFYLAATAWPKAGYVAETYQLIPHSSFPLLVTVYLALCFLFFWSFFDILVLSIRAQRLRLSKDDVVRDPNDENTRARRPSVTLSMISKLRRVRAMPQLLRYLTIFAGIQGRGYEHFALLRDIVQIICQSIQAYDASRFTSNASVILMYVVLVAVTCFAGPVIRRLDLPSLAHRRMTMLLTDLLVDFVCLLLPTLLWKHYLNAYFSGEAFMYRDTFNARAVMELRIVFVASYFSLIVKVIPPMSVFLTVGKLRQLLRRQHQINFTKGVLPDTTRPSLKPSSPSIRNVPNHRVRLRRAARFVSWLLVAWGITVIIIDRCAVHFGANCEMGCQLVVHPWFGSSDCSCTVQEINCYTRRIGGRKDELRAIFSELDHSGLASLIIMHCDTLEIPDEIHWFPNLFTLEIYNSSIVSWPESAEISARHFRRLGSLYLIRTNLTQVPSSLLVSPLPTQLKEIGIIVSNLHDLPDDLDARWPHVRTFYLDYGRFETFPMVLGRMKLESISLCNNSIAVVPNQALASSAFVYLLLNGNPLETLPATLGSTARLYEVQVQFTKVTAIDQDWIMKNDLTSYTTIYGYGAPLCEGDLGDLEERGVLCDLKTTWYGTYHSLSYYTLEGKTAERTLR